jgi:molybdopterin-guanine dinucleotide biosynthesis protein MobB
MPRLPPIVAFAAPSGTGKTTLLEQVARVLVGQGLAVGVLKADAHRVVLDTPGKDSHRFAEAGANPVAVLSAERFALFERLEGEVTLVSVVDRHFAGADLVLAEGFRRSDLPTVRVHRVGGPSDAGWEAPRHVVAWASNGSPSVDVPVLPQKRDAPRAEQRRPGLTAVEAVR